MYVKKLCSSKYVKRKTKAKSKFWILKNISLTLRDAHKDLQKPLVITTYSRDFNHDAELPYKN